MIQLQEYEKKHLAFVRKAASESTLFLNRDESFPLKEAGKIATYGSGVRHTIMGGTGSGEVNSRMVYTIEKGLKRAGFTITTEDWLDAYDQVLEDQKATFAKQLKSEARKAHTPMILYAMGKLCPEPEYDLPLSGEGDVAIYVLSRNSGEGMDRENVPGDIQLTPSEIRDILALNQQYEKFMLVLNVGGVVDLTPVSGVRNILLLSQLGAVTGIVLTDILLGKANPSGKLASTWAAFDDYAKIGDFGDDDETHYKEGIYVGYRYFDSVGTYPLYPFGYGKSYTNFEISFQEVKMENTEITISATIKNTGNYPGREVIQTYVSAPWGELDKPYQDLAAFAKTELLAPEASENISIKLDLKNLASYCEKREAYLLEKGEYKIRLGNSSADTKLVAIVELDETAIVKKVKNGLGDCGFTDFKPERNEMVQNLDCNERNDIIRLHLSASSILSEDLIADNTYQSTDAIEPWIDSLTDEEVTYLLVGGFDPKAKLSIIGNASVHVAGAAGETTSMFQDKGLKTLIMADGPAGLRLARQYYLDAKGNAHGTGVGMLPESMLEYFTGFTGKIAKKLLGGKPAPKGVELKEQYATSLPIGTAVAQTFDCKLAQQYGDLVGEEMERFGVNLWLAPALNIHRDIRCGRNFEYYSEDPLVSGLIAAAITKGVQKHPSCGTTIKHYAANNAETNRYGNNSNVSERAMREIYLKGFEICVKESAPMAVMTSYNLLNGIHTSEHRALTEDILRKEFGFAGIVMTDWVIRFAEKKGGKYRIAHAAETIMAGGDLFMPGGKSDYKDILKAVKDGKLKGNQIRINASRVYRFLKKMTK